MPSKDVRALIRRLRKQGYQVRLGGTGHYRVTGPRGDTITIAASPRARALHQVKAGLRRIGAAP
jgi:hypothetical protein